MGFQFGSVNSIESIEGTECLIIIVVFLLIIEYINKFVDNLKQTKIAIYFMIQKIFKELMIMGIISFSITMMETSEVVHRHINYIESIEFVHILLFFMALFYVAIAIGLIRLASYFAIENRAYHYKDTKKVLLDASNPRSYFGNFLYHSEFLPGSQLRELIEFKVFHSFFIKTYSLPPKFNFSDYLDGCFEKYALELLDVGLFSWLSVIFLALLNLGRVELMKAMELPCTAHTSEEAVEDGSYTAIHVDRECANFNIKVFLVGGGIITIIAIILLVISRVYEIRYNIIQLINMAI